MPGNGKLDIPLTFCFVLTSLAVMSSVCGALLLTRCANCDLRTGYTTYAICCRRLCYTCYITIFVIYNDPPIRDIFYCPFCGLKLTYAEATAIAAILMAAVGKFLCRNDQVILNKTDLLRLLADKWGGGQDTPAVNVVTDEQGISENGCFSKHCWVKFWNWWRHKMGLGSCLVVA